MVMNSEHVLFFLIVRLGPHVVSPDEVEKLWPGWTSRLDVLAPLGIAYVPGFISVASDAVERAVSADAETMNLAFRLAVRIVDGKPVDDVLHEVGLAR